VQDWDAPEGAVEWPRMRSVISHIKSNQGSFPTGHTSHDHMNVQIPVHIGAELAMRWKKKFSPVEGEDEVCYVIADGFLLYWDEECRTSWDVEVFVRESQAVLRRRREDRQGYHTAVQSDPEGLMWKDPPYYWDQIVWPAYLYANKHLFVNEDVERGQIKKEEGLVLLEGGGGEKGMEEMVNRTCEEIWKVVGREESLNH